MLTSDSDRVVITFSVEESSISVALVAPSWLPPRYRAPVQSHEVGRFSRPADRTVGVAAGASAAPASDIDLGRGIFATFFSDEIRGYLRRRKGCDLLLGLDPSLVHIPWESTFDGIDSLGAKFRVARQLTTLGEVLQWDPIQRDEAFLKVLVACGDTTRDQGATLVDSLRAVKPGSIVVEPLDPAANRLQFLAAVERNDVIHFSGGFTRCAAHRREACWRLRRDIVKVADLARDCRPPQLVVAACASQVAAALSREHLAASVSLAGLTVLAYTPAESTERPEEVVSAFYEAIAEGARLGEAVRRARHDARGAAPWFSLYGNPSHVPFVRRHTSTDEGRRQLTFVSCDIVGSTRLQHNMPTEAWSKKLQSFRSICRTRTEQHHGRIHDAVGDEVVALFGLPAREDSVIKAIRAGRSILEDVKKEKLHLDLHIGIDTGPNEIREGHPYGVTISCASKLGKLLESPNVLVSGNTHALARNAFEYEDCGRHVVEGFPKPVHAHRVLHESFGSTAGAMTPFVGRVKERQILEQHWRLAYEGASRVVLITGDAGMGKSRIVREFADSIGHDSLGAITWRCSRDHENTALYPVTEFFKRPIDMREHDDDRTKRRRLERLSWPDDRPPQSDGDLREALLALPVTSSNVVPSFSKRQRDATLAAIVEWIVLETRQSPLCLIVEDVQYLDPSTRELLRLVVAASKSLPVLVLMTARTESGVAWKEQGLVRHRLDLLPLSHAERSKLIVAAAAPVTLDLKHVNALAEGTDGVPLFVEELTKKVVQDLRGSDPVPTSLELRVPASIQDLLMARLDQLATTKRVAQLGSAIGREFSHRLIKSVSDHPDSPIQVDNLDDRLRALVESGLVVQDGAPPRRRLRIQTRARARGRPRIVA